MLKKMITIVTVIAVVGLLSAAAAFASDRQRIRDDDRASAGLQTMEANQLRQQRQAQDPLIGTDALQTRTREHAQVKVQAQLMTEDGECPGCDDPVQDRDRIHQDSDTRPGPNASR